jgi:hypothetical protein
MTAPVSVVVVDDRSLSQTDFFPNIWPTFGHHFGGGAVTPPSSTLILVPVRRHASEKVHE